jgi:hypothetical protein
MVFGAVGVSALTTYLTQQTTTHAKDVAATCVQQVGQHGQALLQACVVQHAATMGLNDTFLISLIGCIICTVLALFVGRDPAVEAAKAAKERGEIVDAPPVPALSE